ncbi:hypothetical protein CYMTET_30500 [Cymbomonas tetramitiformis]|uniref:Uncharacterized protein n=1 Tax=Cymbomonas tetramitiformis TaxID=36881 RepID=A0AAE0FIZ3_9CHLO|nr:hypothetical protein CYMTET_30500 [Cymbomonas tetramitiformis]
MVQLQVEQEANPGQYSALLLWLQSMQETIYNTQAETVRSDVVDCWVHVFEELKNSSCGSSGSAEDPGQGVGAWRAPAHRFAAGCGTVHECDGWLGPAEPFDHGGSLVDAPGQLELLEEEKLRPRETGRRRGSRGWPADGMRGWGSQPSGSGACGGARPLWEQNPREPAPAEIVRLHRGDTLHLRQARDGGRAAAAGCGLSHEHRTSVLRKERGRQRGAHKTAAGDPVGGGGAGIAGALGDLAEAGLEGIVLHEAQRGAFGGARGSERRRCLCTGVGVSLERLCYFGGY